MIKRNEGSFQDGEREREKEKKKEGEGNKKKNAPWFIVPSKNNKITRG